MQLLNYVHVNRIMRVLIVLALILSGALVVAAARPPPKYLGTFDAIVGRAEPFLAQGEQLAGTVTVSHAAVVTFPQDWNRAELFCMMIEHQRGPAPTRIMWDEYLPQTRWDDKPADTVYVYPQGAISNIKAYAAAGGNPALRNGEINGRVTTELGYRVKWIGYDPYPIYADRPVAGIYCLDFDVNGYRYVPPTFIFDFNLQNVNLLQNPRYTFRKGDQQPTDNLPKTVYLLTVQTIDQYLTDLANTEPEIVVKTPANTARQ